MKSTGVIRSLDHLGRIVVPVEFRNALGLENQKLEITLEGETIVLKKHCPGCIFCGEMKDIKTFKNKNICEKCLNEMTRK